MKQKKYIVYESFTFGRNYYNNKLQCVPDYSIMDKIPAVNQNIMEILLERNPFLTVEIAQ